MPTNDHDLNPVHHDPHVKDAESPGYEVTDVNVNGILVFLAGLGGFLVVFFVFCFVMGKVINGALQKADGPTTKWNTQSEFAGAAKTGGKRQDLANNPELQQRQASQLIATFPEPRMETDDGMQGIADLHAREDLLLDHYSTSPGQGASIRIPVSRAMELIAQRGLPVYNRPAGTGVQMVGDSNQKVVAPLTSGFARTSYELDVMEAREQKMNYGRAVDAAHANMPDTRVAP
jgi:hypothetical protein